MEVKTRSLNRQCGDCQEAADMDKNKGKVKLNDELLNTRAKSEEKADMRKELTEDELDMVSGGTGDPVILRPEEESR